MRKPFTQYLFFPLLMLCFGISTQGLFAQCSPDLTPPVLDCSVSAPGNLFLNNSFEEPPIHDRYGADNWTSFGATFSVDANIPGLGPAQDGQYFMKMFGNPSGMFQDFPAAPGDVVTVSAFLRNASWDPMGSTSEGFVKFDYFNAGGGYLGSSEDQKLNGSIPRDVWLPISHTDTVPAGVATVRAVVIYLGFGGGAGMFDNASFTNSNSQPVPLGNVVVYADPGDCGANVQVGVPAASDNCGLFPGLLLNSVNGTGNASGYYSVGTTNVIWTVFDNAFNVDTCSFSITVLDTVAPTILCNPNPLVNTLRNNSFENGAVFNTQFGPEWISFGPAFSIDGSIPGLSPAQDGQFFVKMFGPVSGFFQDNPVQPGDPLTGSVYIRNAGFDPMLPGCEGFIKFEYLNAGGGVMSVVESARINHTIPQDIWTQVVLNDVAPAGAVAVRFVVVSLTPGTGAVMFDNAELYIGSGSITPEVIVDADPGTCSANVSIPYPGLGDNCSVDSTTLNNDYNSTDDASDSYPVGTTTVNWTVQDASGNVGNCAVAVIVNDVDAPVSTSCPSDIDVCDDSVNIVSYQRPLFDDLCMGSNLVGNLSAGLDSGSVFPIGPTLVEWILVDMNDNADTCSFTVTVHEIPSAPSTTIDRCGLEPMAFDLQDHVNNAGNGAPASFSWVAAPVAGISGLSTSPQTGSVITDLPNNPTTSTVTVVYTVTPSSAGLATCTGSDFTVTVTLQPNTNVQALPANICMGQTVDIARLVRDYSFTARSFSFYDGDPAGSGQLIGVARAAFGQAHPTTTVMVSPSVTTTYYVTANPGTACNRAMPLVVSVSRNCGVYRSIIAKLEGAQTGSSQMRTDLQASGVVPALEPYTGLGYAFVGGGGEIMDPAALQNPDVVDWVVLELRDAQTPGIVAYSRAALLLKDGSIVDTDGVKPAMLNANFNSSYYLAVLHRNHLGVMTSTVVQPGSNIDFSDPSVPVYGTGTGRIVKQGTALMIAGDADGNGQVQNTDDVLLWMPNVGRQGYQSGDYNLDGQVQNTDKVLIWENNVGRGSGVPK